MRRYNQSQSLEAQRQSKAVFEPQVKSTSTALEEILSHNRMQMFLIGRKEVSLVWNSNAARGHRCHLLSAPHLWEKSAEQLFKWKSNPGKSVGNEKPSVSMKLFGWKPVREILVKVFKKLLKLLSVDIKGEKTTHSRIVLKTSTLWNSSHAKGLDKFSHLFVSYH